MRRYFILLLLMQSVIQLSGCITLSIKKDDWIGTYSYEEHFKNMDGSKTLIQKYTIIIEKQDGIIIARYAASGFESIQGVICSTTFEKQSVRLSFTKFEDKNMQENEVYSAGNMFLSLKKRGSVYNCNYISDKKKQGVYVFKKIN